MCRAVECRFRESCSIDEQSEMSEAESWQVSAPNVRVTPTPDEPRPSSLLQQQSPAAGRSLSVSCRMLRSPSHESVTTDLSLFSVSSAGAVAGPGSDKGTLRPLSGTSRGASPNTEPGTRVRHADIPEVHWFEEENDLIRSCALLSSALGLQKSFSTSDISHLPLPEHPSLIHTGQAASELALNSLQRSGYLLEHSRLDQTSRSCSTWVAVGDVGGTSQLPSPHGRTCDGTASATGALSFTAADFIRSMNKKVRQNYIRRKLHTTYRALERLSQSEFNLDRLEAVASVAAAVSTVAEPVAAISAIMHPGPTQLIVPSTGKGKNETTNNNNTTKLEKSPPKDNTKVKLAATSSAGKAANLTIRDVERERGKPLSKYERNMMIFNWLHTLDEATAEEVPAQ